MKKILAFGFWLLASGLCLAQEQVEMADELRSSGKIYVVVGVVLTILTGLLLFLILMDRKVNDLEKRVNKNGPPQPSQREGA